MELWTAPSLIHSSWLRVVGYGGKSPIPLQSIFSFLNLSTLFNKNKWSWCKEENKLKGGLSESWDEFGGGQNL